MNTNISSNLQSLIDHLIQKAIPDYLCASGMADEAVTFRDASSWSSAAQVQHMEELLTRMDAAARATPADSFTISCTPISRTALALKGPTYRMTPEQRADWCRRRAWDLGVTLEELDASTSATDGALVRVALELHPERGGASAVGRLVACARPTMTKVAAGGGVMFDLPGHTRKKLLAHLGDPEGNPLPSAPKPGPVRWTLEDEEGYTSENTVKIYLSDEELRQLDERAEGHPGGVSVWIADAIRLYARGGPLAGGGPPVPKDLGLRTWITDPAALARLDKLIEPKYMGSHLRAAVLRSLGSGRMK